MYLAQIAVELSGETEGASGPAHGGGHEVIEVTVGGVRQLEGAEADVVEGLGGGGKEGAREGGRE